jgi:hypothetical protein
MNKTYITHEAPISILDTVGSITDYDYCLVHLLDESEKYRDYFFRQKKAGRRIILDNSIFELGTAFDHAKYEQWIVKLEPFIYIMPDVLGDLDATVENANVWSKKKFNSRPMAVVQGQSMDELTTCYTKFIHLGINTIAIGFNHDFFVRDESTRDWDQANGRIKFVQHLLNKFYWNGGAFINDGEGFYHHLLGCSLPVEFCHSIYQSVHINSIDTSSPVLHGLLGVDYEPLGILTKKKIKMNDLIHANVTSEQLQKIIANIHTFSDII